MIFIRKRLRAGAPFTLGENVKLQTFGVETTCVEISKNYDKVLKSDDFIGYSEDGEYVAASYSQDDFGRLGGSQYREPTFSTDSDVVG